MHRALLVGLLLISSPVFAQSFDSFKDRRTSSTPFWLPRSVFVGLGLGAQTTLSAEGRVQWEFTIVQQRVDALIAYVSAGGGLGLSLPTRVGTLSRYQPLETLNRATGQLGVGYRGDRGNWSWGFQAGGGPLLYHAVYTPVPEQEFSFPEENKVVGWIEARAQAGYRFNDSLAGGIAIQFGSGLGAPRAGYAYDFLGGWTFGIYVDWR